MKKILFFAIFCFTAFSSKAQFSLTPVGLVNSENPSLNYYVLSVKGKSQSDLYKSALIYLSSLYQQPKEVISPIENEVISIRGMDKKAIKAKTGWVIRFFDVDYNIKFMFKDGKIRIDAPVILKMQNVSDGTLRVIGLNDNQVNAYERLNGSITIFKKDGSVRNDIAKNGVEAFFNTYIADFTKAMTLNQNSNW